LKVEGKNAGGVVSAPSVRRSFDRRDEDKTERAIEYGRRGETGRKAVASHRTP
jgi:hypothetical protein